MTLRFSVKGKIIIELSILNVAWKALFRLVIFFSLETVNFELLAFDQSTVYQESADILSLITLQSNH